MRLTVRPGLGGGSERIRYEPGIYDLSKTHLVLVLSAANTRSLLPRSACKDAGRDSAQTGRSAHRNPSCLPLSESITAMMVHVKHNSRVPRTHWACLKYKSLKASRFLTGPFGDRAQTTALSFFVPIDSSWRAVIPKYILADFKTN